MKKLFLLSLVLWVCFPSGSVRAQYSISPLSPPPVFSFNDLWHFTITRNANDGYVQFYVSLRIYDGTNNLLVKSNTVTFPMAVGSRYFNTATVGELQPFTTSYYDAGTWQQTIASGGNFPPGAYHMVYTLYGKAKDGEFTPLAEDALQADVETLWPPLLLSPEDNETIQTTTPLLTWTPAFYSAGGAPIVYNLRLVELHEKQTPYQALQSNPVWLAQRDIPSTMLAYPASGAPLKKGGMYGWQVEALSDGRSIGYSQAWSFRVSTDETDTEILTAPYVEVTPDYRSHTYMALFGKVNIKYVEEYVLPDNAGNLQFRVYNWKGQVVMSSGTHPPLPIKKGHNYVTVDAAPLASGALGGLGPYLLEVYNHKNEKQYIRFRITGINTGGL